MSGLLCLVAVVTGNQRSEFTYDGFSRRTKIVEKVSGTVTGTKQFVWVGGEIAEERNDSDVVQKKFFGLGEWRNGVGNLYYARDHLGNLRELTDGSNAVRARYEYDPYGRRSANLITGGNALAADWGFAGHYYHAPSGLHLAWFRAYDANLGRWISRDPIAERGGMNLYGYVANNPLGWIDPYGLNVQDPGRPPENIPVIGDPDARWVEGPKTGNRVRFIPDRPVPSQPGQELSWGGKEEYWKRTDGAGGEQRFDHWGNPQSRKNAHEMPHRRPKSGAGKLWGAILGFFVGGACGLQAAADHGSFNDVYSAAANGEDDLDDLMYDASIDAAIESGQAAALPVIYNGWDWLKWWHDFWGD